MEASVFVRWPLSTLFTMPMYRHISTFANMKTTKSMMISTLKKVFIGCLFYFPLCFYLFCSSDRYGFYCFCQIAGHYFVFGLRSCCFLLTYLNLSACSVRSVDVTFVCSVSAVLECFLCMSLSDLMMNGFPARMADLYPCV